MNPAPERTSGGMSKHTDQNQVPTVTLSTIRQLIPASQRERGGERFVVSLLALASSVQPFTPPGQAASFDVAIIQVQSIRALAKHIQWGYDTTNKYIILLIELGFLYKRRHRDRIELYFPLTPIPLPPLALFDRIKRRRRKVNSFVAQVKRRLALLSESPVEQGGATGLIPDIDRILQDERLVVSHA